MIIGAGLMGCSTALQLAKRGIKCHVLEKDNPGRHASGVNAGGLRQLNRAVAEIPLTVEASKMWKNIQTIVDDDCDVKLQGQVRVAESQADLNLLEKRESLVRKLGYHHEEMIGRDELYRLIPDLSPHCVGALISREDGFARPYHVTTAFRQKAEKLGVIFHTQSKAIHCEPIQNNWKITTSDEVFYCDILMNCAGAWANQVAKELNEPVPLKISAPMLMITARVKHFLNVVVGVASRKLSFKQMQNGTLLIGGAHMAKYNPDDESTEIDFQQLAVSAKTVIDLFPHLKNVSIVRTWAGLEAFMPDNIPVISKSKNHDNAYHAFGFSAHGFQLSPVIGCIMADLVTEGKTHLPIEPFSIKRFGNDDSAIN
ncbi:MAG: FAD-binding oxidoreductase [Methylococcales bacterium]|nr:FAD-binding oxidoreductase [Methylococcales bacterium]